MSIDYVAPSNDLIAYFSAWLKNHFVYHKTVADGYTSGLLSKMENEFFDVVGEVFAKVYEDTTKLFTVFNIDKCDIKYLHHIAESLGIDEYQWRKIGIGVTEDYNRIEDYDLSEKLESGTATDEEIERIKTLITENIEHLKRKGTKDAIEKIFRIFGVFASIVPLWTDNWNGTYTRTEETFDGVESFNDTSLEMEFSTLAEIVGWADERRDFTGTSMILYNRPLEVNNNEKDVTGVEIVYNHNKQILFTGTREDRFTLYSEFKEDDVVVLYFDDSSQIYTIPGTISSMSIGTYTLLKLSIPMEDDADLFHHLKNNDVNIWKLRREEGDFNFINFGLRDQTQLKNFDIDIDFKMSKELFTNDKMKEVKFVFRAENKTENENYFDSYYAIGIGTSIEDAEKMSIYNYQDTDIIAANKDRYMQLYKLDSTEYEDGEKAIWKQVLTEVAIPDSINYGARVRLRTKINNNIIQIWIKNSELEEGHDGSGDNAQDIILNQEDNIDPYFWGDETPVIEYDLEKNSSEDFITLPDILRIEYNSYRTQKTYIQNPPHYRYLAEKGGYGIMTKNCTCELYNITVQTATKELTLKSLTDMRLDWKPEILDIFSKNDRYYNSLTPLRDIQETFQAERLKSPINWNLLMPENIYSKVGAHLIGEKKFHIIGGKCTIYPYIAFTTYPATGVSQELDPYYKLVPYTIPTTGSETFATTGTETTCTSGASGLECKTEDTTGTGTRTTTGYETSYRTQWYDNYAVIQAEDALLPTDVELAITLANKEDYADIYKTTIYSVLKFIEPPEQYGIQEELKEAGIVFRTHINLERNIVDSYYYFGLGIDGKKVGLLKVQYNPITNTMDETILETSSEYEYYWNQIEFDTEYSLQVVLEETTLIQPVTGDGTALSMKFYIGTNTFECIDQDCTFSQVRENGDYSTSMVCPLCGKQAVLNNKLLISYTETLSDNFVDSGYMGYRAQDCFAEFDDFMINYYRSDLDSTYGKPFETTNITDLIIGYGDIKSLDNINNLKECVNDKFSDLFMTNRKLYEKFPDTKWAQFGV